MVAPTLLESLVKSTSSVHATEGARGAGFVPPGVVLPFAGSTAPTGWLLAYGQAVSRTTYADLYAAIGTTFGVGDGSTTFNLPDMRGRVAAGKDDMGGTAANRLNVTLTGTRASTSSGVITGLSSTVGLSAGMSASGTGVGNGAVINSIDSGSQVTLSVNSSSTGSGSIRFGVVDGATLGAVGGAHTHALATGQLPAHNHPVFLNDPGHVHNVTAGANLVAGTSFNAGYDDLQQRGGSVSGHIVNNTTGITVRDASGGGGTANQTATAGGGAHHPIMQPTIVHNFIIKT